MSVTVTALRLLALLNVVLVVEEILIVLPDKLDHYLELEVAGDALQRKVGFLDLLSSVFDHVVVVVRYATPIFVRF